MKLAKQSRCNSHLWLLFIYFGGFKWGRKSCEKLPSFIFICGTYLPARDAYCGGFKGGGSFHHPFFTLYPRGILFTDSSYLQWQIQGGGVDKYHQFLQCVPWFTAQLLLLRLVLMAWTCNRTNQFCTPPPSFHLGLIAGSFCFITVKV